MTIRPPPDPPAAQLRRDVARAVTAVRDVRERSTAQLEVPVGDAGAVAVLERGFANRSTSLLIPKAVAVAQESATITG